MGNRKDRRTKAMQSRKPKPANDKTHITVTAADLRKMEKRATGKALIMMIATCMDEFDWTEETVEDFAVRLDRYVSAVDDHTITLKTVSEIIERVTGLKAYMEG